MTDLLRELARQQLDSLDDSVRLIIIHPNFVQQRALLGLFLNNDSTAYIRFEGNTLTEKVLLEQFQVALSIQRADLATVRYVVLDECDRALQPALDEFLLKLIGQVSKGQVVVFSRLAPDCSISPSPLRFQTRFIPTASAFMLADYAQSKADTSMLDVYALGSGRVILNGRMIDDWDGALPRALFFYLVDRGMTTRSEIFDTFWPGLSVREATNVFHVTKRKISEVLGIDLTVYWSGFYHLSPRITLNYDAALFSEMIQDSAVASPADAARLLQTALWLYQGDYLSTTDTSWARYRRQQLLQSYGEALIGLGKLMEQSGNTREALGFYIRASSTNRQREDLARSIMIMYRDLGMPGDALATYERLEAELDQTLGVSPARHLQELAAEIRPEVQRMVG